MLLEAAIAELPRGEVMMGSHTSSTATVTILQDDHEFGGRILKKDVPNRSRLAYKSSASMQAGGVPFQWESRPGKPKSLNARDEDEYKPPVTLSPIRIPSSSNSPSPSRAQSPSSSTNKVIKSLVMNVKRPESSTSNGPESSFNRSPSSISSPRDRNSPLSAMYGSLQGSSSPSLRQSSCNSEDYPPSTDSNFVHTSPMLYSPYTPSPYYFSPLSNASSQMSDIASPHNSTADAPNSHAIHSPNTPSYGLDMLKTHPFASNGSVSSTSKLHARHGALGNSSLSMSSFSHADARIEDDGLQHSGDSLSFASPEMEILDEGLTASYNAGKLGVENTMAEFINRGGPTMHRSFSTSRVTFADDHKRKAAQKYYSAQLNAMAEPKTRTLPLQDPTCSALDKLFPLRRPNQFKVGPDMVSNSHFNESMKEQVDGMGCSNGGAMSSMSNPLERAAQEVIIQASDEEGFAYTPVASAFVFSPRRAPQNSYFPRSSSARVLKEEDIALDVSGTSAMTRDQPSLKSILKKTSYSHELATNVHSTQSQLALPRSSSQKISSVLLRFAEAQERLYSSAPSTPHHHRHASNMPTTACLQPMCSFLGRAFLCRSKLAVGCLHQ